MSGSIIGKAVSSRALALCVGMAVGMPLLSIAPTVARADPPPTPPANPATPPAAGDANAATGAPPAAPAGTTPAPATAAVTTPAGDTYKVGVDYYFGISNVPTPTNPTGVTKRITDGAWAGSTTFFPSNAHADWTHGTTDSAHVSIGIGDQTIGANHQFQEPMEAYYTHSFAEKSGSVVSVTGGKFFTPFGLQEWEYEGAYGVQIVDVANSQFTYTLSVQDNRTVHDANLYAHVAYTMTSKTVIGASFGAGKGWTYSSTHKTGYGADLTQDLGGYASLVAEYVHADGPSGDFNFGVARATLTRLGKFRPFLGLWDWKDKEQPPLFGDFKSAVLGLGYQQSPHVYFEPAYARTANRDVFWLEAKLSL